MLQTGGRNILRGIDTCRWALEQSLQTFSQFANGVSHNVTELGGKEFMNMNRRAFALLMGSTGWLQAADPWKEKKAAEFTPEDMQKLASKSPWSKEATVSMQMPSGGPSGGGGGGLHGALGERSNDH